jgi:hypothetical protein
VGLKSEAAIENLTTYSRSFRCCVDLNSEAAIENLTTYSRSFRCCVDLNSEAAIENLTTYSRSFRCCVDLNSEAAIENLTTYSRSFRFKETYRIQKNVWHRDSCVPENAGDRCDVTHFSGEMQQCLSHDQILFTGFHALPGLRHGQHRPVICANPLGEPLPKFIIQNFQTVRGQDCEQVADIDRGSVDGACVDSHVDVLVVCVKSCGFLGTEEKDIRGL